MVKPKEKIDETEEMLPEYDFSNGSRGMFAGKSSQDRIAVVLDPDIAELFSTSDAVNEALRGLADNIAKTNATRQPVPRL